jgi:hypothetical protein
MKKKSSHEEGNPHLKATFLEVVDNQLNANNPPETHGALTSRVRFSDKRRTR